MTVFNAYLSGMRASISPVWRLRSDRLWEIDLLRGIAIIMMVIYHLMWDLRGFGGYPIDVYSGFWRYWQVATASLFTGLVGLSLTLSYHRSRLSQPQGSLWPKYVMRGLQIFTWGMVVSLVTFVFDPSHYVRFGILHLIGLSIIIAYPFLTYRWLNLALGVGVILLGSVIRASSLDLAWLGFLGLDSTPGPTFDYSPLIPWFGRVLIGIFIGNTLYVGGVRRFPLPDLSHNAVVEGLRLMGQNSLLIYLVHQPIMIAALVLFGVVSF